jgi:hypothetical protein
MAAAPKAPAEAESSKKVGFSKSSLVHASLIAVFLQLMLINTVNL